MSVLCLLSGLVAAGLAGIRWLRVAQREHYLGGSADRFATRWWALGPNRVLGAAAIIGLGLAALGVTPAGIVAAAAVAAGPFGLGLRGRTSKLAWTRRMRTLAAVWAVLTLLPVLLGSMIGLFTSAVLAVTVAVLAPALVDLALFLTDPLEHALGAKFVTRARERLASVRPVVVAITGSYGKTSTKGYIAHLAGGTRAVVASPASFNNRNGLARTVNEHLAPGTEVLIAEMGTYGPGEIAEMCDFVPPDIAVITAIGPVHLERMHSEENILEAKAEITERASVVVLNVDNPWLLGLADRLDAIGGKKVVRVTAEDGAGGPEGAPATNVACAIAVARELGVSEEVIRQRLVTLPVAAFRLAVSTGAAGFTIIDDTYNSNPAGARAALDALLRNASPNGRRVVVTPGMVELGHRQHDENAAFAQRAADIATHLVIVGHTNRRALQAGAAEATAMRCEIVLVETREQAVSWVQEHLGPGDTVLYENDLPDHFA